MEVVAASRPAATKWCTDGQNAVVYKEMLSAVSLLYTDGYMVESNRACNKLTKGAHTHSHATPARWHRPNPGRLFSSHQTEAGFPSSLQLSKCVQTRHIRHVLVALAKASLMDPATMRIGWQDIIASTVRSPLVVLRQLWGRIPSTQRIVCCLLHGTTVF